MKKSSIWLDNIDFNINESLNKDIDVDVLIIGGGITGLSIAYHLINSNLKVCLVEKNIVGHGVTARTTGKLTYLQELIYTKLDKTFGSEKAKLYLESQKEAIEIVESIIKENKIDCDYEKVSSYVFTNNSKDIEKIKKEKLLLEKFNVEVNECNKLPDLKEIEYGISVDDTAVFHPLKYLNGLKRICDNKIKIYENTKVVDINKEDNIFICKTNKNNIKAKKVVLSLHYPYFLFPFLTPLKTHLEKSYICAYEIDKDYLFSAITSNKPTLSLRYLESDKIYKIVLNQSHNLAFKNNDQEHFDKLIKSLKKEPDYIWSNKDIITSDNLPYIGKIEENLFLATGYNTWGMTNGSLAGKIISDMILEKDNKYIELFNPKRGLNSAKLINFPIDLVSNVKSFIGSKINKNKSWYDSRVIFETIDGKNVAIYIDENDKKHIVYNKCPHLKCSLNFNEKEKTWDCPCHGSRFDIDGKCIEGPSNYDIVYKEK